MEVKPGYFRLRTLKRCPHLPLWTGSERHGLFTFYFYHHYSSTTVVLRHCSPTRLPYRTCWKSGLQTWSSEAKSLPVIPISPWEKLTGASFHELWLEITDFHSQITIVTQRWPHCVLKDHQNGSFTFAVSLHKQNSFSLLCKAHDVYISYHIGTHTHASHIKPGLLGLLWKAGAVCRTYLTCTEHTQQSLSHAEESKFQQALAPASSPSSSGTAEHKPGNKGLVHDTRILSKFNDPPTYANSEHKSTV